MRTVDKVFFFVIGMLFGVLVTIGTIVFALNIDKKTEPATPTETIEETVEEENAEYEIVGED